MTARVVNAASGFTPTTLVDGAQAAVFLTSGSVYQDIVDTYEPGFRYAFTTYMASSVAVTSTSALLYAELRDRSNNVLASRAVTA
jgi:hypothetical protein